MSVVRAPLLDRPVCFHTTDRLGNGLGKALAYREPRARPSKGLGPPLREFPERTPQCKLYACRWGPVVGCEFLRVHPGKSGLPTHYNRKTTRRWLHSRSAVADRALYKLQHWHMSKCQVLRNAKF